MQCPSNAAPLASSGLRLAYQHGGVFQCSAHGPLPLRRVRALATKGSARSWQCAQGVHGACATSARPQQERPVCCQALMIALVRSDVHCTSVLLHLCARQQRRCRRQATQLLAVALSAAWRALRMLAHIHTAAGHGTSTCTWFPRLVLSFELVLLVGFGAMFLHKRHSTLQTLQCEAAFGRHHPVQRQARFGSGSQAALRQCEARHLSNCVRGHKWLLAAHALRDSRWRSWPSMAVCSRRWWWWAPQSCDQACHVIRRFAGTCLQSSATQRRLATSCLKAQNPWLIMYNTFDRHSSIQTRPVLGLPVVFKHAGTQVALS